MYDRMNDTEEVMLQASSTNHTSYEVTTTEVIIQYIAKTIGYFGFTYTHEL